MSKIETIYGIFAICLMVILGVFCIAMLVKLVHDDLLPCDWRWIETSECLSIEYEKARNILKLQGDRLDIMEGNQ